MQRRLPQQPMLFCLKKIIFQRWLRTDLPLGTTENTTEEVKSQRSATPSKTSLASLGNRPGRFSCAVRGKPAWTVFQSKQPEPRPQKPNLIQIETNSNQILICTNVSKALFGWAFGFGFWPQKPKAQPKRLLFEGAFSEAAAFPQFIFESWFDPAFGFWLSAFRNWWNKKLFHSCFKRDKDKMYILYLFNQTAFSFSTAHSPQQLFHSSQPTTAFSHSHSSTKHGLNTIATLEQSLALFIQKIQ